MQCRVCMQTQSHILMDMGHASSEDGKTLFDCFNECTQLHAMANDTFPSMLCKICVQKMQIAYNFRKCALQSNEYFKKLLTKRDESESLKNTTEEMFALEVIEENNDDPLNMDFDEASRVLREPEVKFTPEVYSIDKSPYHYLEEAELSINEDNKEDIVSKTEIEINSTAEENYFDQFESIVEKESESDEGGYETEIEPMEKNAYACEMCKGTYAFKADLRKHIAQNHKSAIICISCSKVFDMPDELRVHKKLVHDTDSPVLCDFCKDKPIMPRSEIRTHFKEHHSSRYFKYFPRIRITRAIGSGEPTTYKCKYCWNIFTTAFELEDHVKTHIFKCPFCSKNFSRIRTYYNHVKRLHNCSASSYPPTPFVVYGPDAEDEKPIYCKACNKTYLRLGSYNRHIKQKHRKRSLTHETDKIDLDKVQEKTIDDLQPVELLSSQLQIESIFHSPEQSQVYVEKLPEIISEEKLSEYQHCPNKIEETYDVTHTDAGEYTEQLQELDYDPNEDEMTCTVLGEEENLNKSFERQKKSIIRKKANRSKQKKKNEYLCSFCPQVLSSRTTLEMHENIKHLNVKTQEECPICKKKLKPSYISTHIQMVHNEERNYVCDICEDSYKTKNQLKRHKMLHDKDSGLPCTVCDKKFTERADLNVHMRLHTGELPYACHICDRRFRIKVRLTYHLQHHANIKKKCKICDKEFKNGTSLRKHSYEHTGNFPYTCTNCDYRHVNREYFCKHMLNKHGKVMSADELFAMFKANTGRNPYVKKAEDLENMNINS